MKKRAKATVSYLYGHKFLLSLIINIFLFVFYLVFYSVKYETNDDIFMDRIASGFNGKNEPYLIFINYVLGFFLKVLYQINESICWYDLIQCLTCFFAVTSVSWFLLKTVKNKWNIIFAVILNVFLAYELYVNVQFTKTAGFATAGGVLVILYYSLFYDKINRTAVIGIISGSLLSVLGFLYRSDAFFVSVFLCSAVGVLFLLKYGKDRKKIFKRLLTCAVSFIPLICMVGAAFIIDSAACASDEWKDYYIRNDEISNIIDFGGMEYYQSDSAKEQFGIDKIDTDFIDRWNFEDTDFLSTENVTKYNEVLIRDDRTPVNIAITMAKHFVAELTVGHYFPYWLFLIFLLSVFLLNNPKLKDYFVILYVLFLIFVLFYYLIIQHRYFYNRINSIIFYVSSVPLVMLLDDRPVIKSLKNMIIIFAAVFLAFQTFHTEELRFFNRDNSAKEKEREVYSEIAKDKEHLYIATSEGLQFDLAYNIFDDIPFGQGENIYHFGWTAYSLTVRAVLKKYNVDNPAADMVDNESVYLIDEDIDGTLAYIRKHHSKNAKAVLVKNINDHKIYKILS